MSALPSQPIPNRDRAIDKDTLKDYRTETANVIDDFGLSPYAHRLYSHYKRAAGDSECEQGTRYIAKICCMSLGKVISAKRELVEDGLIWIEPRAGQHGDIDVVTLPDLWQYNFEIYATRDKSKRQELVENMKRSLREHPLQRSSHELMRSRGELMRSRREQKNKHLKKEHSKKESTPLKIAAKESPKSEIVPSEDSEKKDPSFNGSPEPTLRDGFTWWFAGEDGSTRHLYAPKTQKPMCKKSPWRSPNKWQSGFLGYEPCPDCLKAMADWQPPSLPITDDEKNEMAILCYGSVDAFKDEKLAKQIMSALKRLKLLTPGMTDRTIKAFSEDWFAIDFRGKKGQRPKPRWIPDEWMAFKERHTNEEVTNGGHTGNVEPDKPKSAILW